MKTQKHCRDCGAAVNVKTHGVTFADGGTDAQRETAYNRMQESWWRDANEAARACGYYGASACGRSGGWCAPYDDAGGIAAPAFEPDENAPRFVAFVGRVEALMKSVPDRFASELREVIAEDAKAERDEAARETRRKLERAFCASFRDDDMRDAMADGSTIIGEAFNALRAARPVSLLRIDAWREVGGGWTWNNWHKLASVPMSWADMKPRALLRELRAQGYIEGAGRLAVDDDGYNLVVMAKGTREPLLAIAYGEAP